MARVRTKPKLNFARRASGGTQSRFRLVPTTDPVPRDQASLPAGHPALVENRTLFPSRVFDAGERDRILVRGYQNSKIGDHITHGPWAGFRIFTFALEERATCPSSCQLLDACYGNALHLAVRFRFNDGFLMSLEEELVAKGDEFPGGFAVRAQVLGDIPTLDYLHHWQLWMKLVPALHVWGYTAHQVGTPIGDAAKAMNTMFPGRWVFRQSVAPDAEVADWQASTTWEKPVQVSSRGYRAIGGVVCPAEVGATATCGSCGLCWSPASADTRIVFLGHGTRPGAGVRHAKTDAKYSDPVPAPRGSLLFPASNEGAKSNEPPPSDRFDSVDAFIAARGVTRLPPAKARGL